MAKTAFVTGGAGGIGQAICKRLADAGHKVAACYITAEKESALAWQKEGKEQGYDYYLVEGDVSDFDSCKEMAEKVEKDMGPVDILVNCAGITKDTTFKKMKEDQWKSVIDINLNSVFNVTKQFLDGMLERQHGRIICISSLNGQKGQFGQSNYSASKSGMHGFAMSLAQEVANKGITVNSVSPGYIGTKMVMAIPEKVRNQIIAQIPVGRLGAPDEIGAVVVFLASDDAGFITGSNIAINGGQHTQF
uniref:3-oxoacyl-[acyl-carrier-protein] reductase n=1 Tax=Candidatus Kentrum sp. LPFa TaxID=2126335 RepID=A0A450Y031_9GAMM|nr:MAG: 3-oxoacyl-[acyl-carrier-protein] reductase [Candidatus Kentron sp. LPFa]VFK34875.1 MAG: 3-oxoacyl-[acyl-carrier-protein] reductase [Candidatus Kentron sp. LPFa]